MQPGEICLANFPLGDVPGMKLRPVLLLTGPLGRAPEILVAYISSVVPSNPMASDIILDPASSLHAGAGLKTLSVVRLHKLATIHARSIVRQLGAVSPDVQAEVRDKLRSRLRLS